jgi:hypothetical protein
MAAMAHALSLLRAVPFCAAARSCRTLHTNDSSVMLLKATGAVHVETPFELPKPEVADAIRVMAAEDRRPVSQFLANLVEDAVVQRQQNRSTTPP